jgi:nucleoside-diphosphate-sugar epimerase
VIFISSTSVYDNDQITEETPLNPDSEGKQLAIVEDVLHSNSRFKTTVLRFEV